MKDVKRKTLNILMADDDLDFSSLMSEALKQVKLDGEFCRVIDGEELLDHLSRLKNSNGGSRLPPDLILLDLNMPRKNGFEALKEIRADQAWGRIPVIMFTISKDTRDILRSYELGANTFITKPFSFNALVKMLQAIKEYWLEFAELPSFSD